MRSISSSAILFGALWLFFVIAPVWGGGCPHCRDMLASCRYTDSNKVCPLIQVVATNTSICAGVGAGCLALAGLLKPRFLRLFSKISFETILALVKRAEPGTAFEITTSTKASTILAGVANGMVALDIAVLKLVELSEDTTDDDLRKTLLQRLECLKTANDIQHKAPARITTRVSSGLEQPSSSRRRSTWIHTGMTQRKSSEHSCRWGARAI